MKLNAYTFAELSLFHLHDFQNKTLSNIFLYQCHAHPDCHD